MLPNAAAKIEVSGLVQGVGFRWFVKEEADLLGLSGTARNLPGGSVEVNVEGGRDLIEKLIATLKEGNRSSRVEQVSVIWSIAQGKFNNFSILTRD